MARLLFFLKKAIPRKIFLFLAPVYHFSLSFCAAVFYGFPSRRLNVIAVTGTSGKTTVVELICAALASAGFKVSSASSLCFRICGKEERNFTKMTMPGRFFIQRFLRRAVRAGCEYAVLEITSEGIKQFRHRFLKLDAAVLTNVSPEHVEAHGGFERYLRAKLDLFWRLSPGGAAVINADDETNGRFRAASNSANTIFYGKNGIVIGEKTLPVGDLIVFPDGIEFSIGGVRFSSSLAGEFNFYNVLAAVSAGLSRHISLEKIAAAVSSLKNVSGRMEFLQKKPFAAVVDYAHTPDSLKKAYSFLSGLSFGTGVSSGLICVLGAAGGGRDKWKRPELGKTASQFCREIILTNEDPYEENPLDIINQIEAGLLRNAEGAGNLVLKKILDRREAIRASLKSARPGDTVIITGKGAEPWIMGPNNERIPWDDREVVKEELAKLKF